jgi:hypothetical protein
MPLVFRIDHEARVVVVAAYGTLTDDEVFGYERQMSERTDIAGYHELIDTSNVGHIAVPSADRVDDLAKEAAGKDAAHGPAKLAIVAPRDLAFGLGRMFKARREMDPRSTKDVGVFRTMADALKFLEVDHPLALPTLD